jgi:hypothetical protein
MDKKKSSQDQFLAAWPKAQTELHLPLCEQLQAQLTSIFKCFRSNSLLALITTGLRLVCCVLIGLWGRFLDGIRSLLIY